MKNIRVMKIFWSEPVLLERNQNRLRCIYKLKKNITLVAFGKRAWMSANQLNAVSVNQSNRWCADNQIDTLWSDRGEIIMDIVPFLECLTNTSELPRGWRSPNGIRTIKNFITLLQRNSYYDLFEYVEYQTIRKWENTSNMAACATTVSSWQFDPIKNVTSWSGEVLFVVLL